MDFAGGFGPQVHDEVGAAQGEAPDAGAGGGNFVSAVVAGSGFQGGDDFDAAGEQAAFAFQRGYGGVDLGDLLGGFGTADHDTVEAGPDGGSEVGQHEFGINLDKYLSAAGLDRIQVRRDDFAGGRFVGLGDEFDEVEDYYVGAGLVSG